MLPLYTETRVDIGFRPQNQLLMVSASGKLAQRPMLR